MIGRARWLLFPLVASLLAGASAPAGAQRASAQGVDTTCTAAYTAGQRLRNKGLLRAATEQLATCAHQECSPVLRGDCTQWLAEVEALMPSLVIAARGPSGEDVIDVRVLVDGALLAEKIGGVPVALDPGQHRLRFEMEGAQPVEKEVVVREGEKARRIDVAFVSSTATSAPATTPAGAPTGSAPPEAPQPGASAALAGPNQASRSSPPLAYVLGGVGVAALAAGVYLDVDGLGKRSSLDSCKPNCNPDDVNAAKTTILVGDVAAGVGAALLVAAAYMVLTRQPSPSPALGAVRPQVVPIPGDRGVLAGVAGAF